MDGSPVIRTEPWGAKATALEGAKNFFKVPEDDLEEGEEPKVCVEVLGSNVVITRIHFTAGGIDLVNLTLYKQDKVTPLPGQVFTIRYCSVTWHMEHAVEWFRQQTQGVILV